MTERAKLYRDRAETCLALAKKDPSSQHYSALAAQYLELADAEDALDEPREATSPFAAYLGRNWK
jgi:hypothetical protein